MDFNAKLEPDELADAISILPQNADWLPSIDDLILKYKIEDNYDKYEKFIRWILASIPDKTVNDELKLKLFLRKYLNNKPDAGPSI